MERGMSGRGHKATFWADRNYIVIAFAYLGLAVSQGCTTKICAFQCIYIFTLTMLKRIIKYGVGRGQEEIKMAEY